MQAMAKPKRSERRASDRAQAKLGKDLERLWKLGPGGGPERPIAITSPAEVEVIARSTRCPICEGELRLEDHLAETLGGARLRVARVACVVCRARRSIYFQLRATTLN
jgi:hypothetical protein